MDIKTKKYDFLIVGAGFSGCVLAERLANELGKSVLILEARNHIGGNCFDFYDKYGVLIHKYGPHLFHTKMRKVWDYLSRFTEWINYEHRVLAEIDSKRVPIPFNFDSIESLFPEGKAKIIIEKLLKKYGEGTKVPILKLLEQNDRDLKELADFVYQKVFLGYNLKQWGMRPEDLDPSVSGRVPVLCGRDDRYFQDQFQAMPKQGYTFLFEKMLDNKNIDVLLKSEYKDILNKINYNNLIYTGAIDSFFDFKFGKLPYRSLEFDFVNFKQKFYQECTQINFPNEHNYTRTTEFKHATAQKKPSTTVAFEYPKAFELGINDPYYPIPSDINHALFEKYNQEAKKLSQEQNIYFTGRLAMYKYFNMDETIGVALSLFNKIAEKEREKKEEKNVK